MELHNLAALQHIALGWKALMLLNHSFHKNMYSENQKNLKLPGFRRTEEQTQNCPPWKHAGGLFRIDSPTAFSILRNHVACGACAVYAPSKENFSKMIQEGIFKAGPAYLVKRKHGAAYE